MSDQRIDKLESKIDKMTDSLHSIDKTLAKQEENLKEHMRRTELAERNHEALRNEFKPVKEHVHRVEGMLKLLGIFALIVTVSTGLIKLISLL